MNKAPAVGTPLLARQATAIQQTKYIRGDIRTAYERKPFQPAPIKTNSSVHTKTSVTSRPVLGQGSAFAEALAASARRLLDPSARFLTNAAPLAKISSVLQAARTASEDRPVGEVHFSGQNSDPIPNVPFADLIYSTAKAYEVSPYLVAAVVKAESGFNPLAQSKAGAKGLMQLMDGTARSLGVSSVFDPAQNIEGGVRFLSSLLKKYGGDTRLALAAYNAGPGAVDKYGGIPPYKETRDYIAKVLGYWKQFQQNALREEDASAI